MSRLRGYILGLSGPVALASLVALSGCGTPKRFAPVAGGTISVPGLDAEVPALLGIGLAENRTALDLDLSGPTAILDGDTGRSLGVLPADARRLHCRLRAGRVFWTCANDSGLSDRLLLRPVDPDHHLGFDSRRWRGGFAVFPALDGEGLTLVNNVELEAYLQGVVPWEIGRPGRPALAALEAQAVAARTYTVSHLQERADRGFDLFADVMDQVYRGATDEDPLCNEAINRTRGLVLSVDGGLVEAYYSACCGGVSSAIEQVWPRPARGYLRSRPDARGGHGEPWCGAYKYAHWEQAWTGPELEAILRRTLPAYVRDYGEGARGRWAGRIFSPAAADSRPDQPGRLLGLEILRRTPSGRVADLAVRTTAGTYHVRGDRTRWVLAPPEGQGAILRSALFDLAVDQGPGGILAVKATGRGYGHGIGMCQVGAIARARGGQDVQEILGHYYPGARLVRLGAGR